MNDLTFRVFNIPRGFLGAYEFFEESGAMAVYTIDDRGLPDRLLLEKSKVDDNSILVGPMNYYGVFVHQKALPVDRIFYMGVSVPEQEDDQ